MKIKMMKMRIIIMRMMMIMTIKIMLMMIIVLMKMMMLMLLMMMDYIKMGEMKKKIQLVEGERKAIFEDCEREKEENREKIREQGFKL